MMPILISLLLTVGLFALFLSVQRYAMALSFLIILLFLDSKKHKLYFQSVLPSLALGFVMLFSSQAMAGPAPTPNIATDVPDKYLVGEDFCFTATFSNSNDTGYGPYLRLITKPDFSFISSSLLNLPVEVIPVAGTLPGASPGLIDPISGTVIIGPAGSSVTILRLPIGSVVTGGIPLNVNICIDFDKDAVIDVIQNDAIQIVPAYEYGDTATGDNGTIIGSVDSSPVTPELIHFTEHWISPETENPPGPEFPFPVHGIANIASNLTVTPVTFPTINIDEERQFVGPITITGGTGCTITATSAKGQVQTGSSPFSPTHMTVPGGKLDVDCTSAIGTGTEGAWESTDVLVDFSVYIIDILDETVCTTEADPWVNTGKHVVIRKGGSTTSVPGNTLTFSLNFAVSEYATATYIRIEDILPDGYTYVATTGMTIEGSSYSITPVVDHNNATGITKLTYNVSDVHTNDYAPTTTGVITYTAIIDQSYEATNLPVESNDSLNNTVEIFYTTLQGAGTLATPCIENSAATVLIQPIATSKIIVNPLAEYRPGDEVIFRLKMDIPSGDTRNIVFEDYFPLPVFIATAINTSTNLGTNPNISIATGDTLGLTPTSITTDATQNKLRITWPDVTTTTPQSIVIDVKVTVSTEPFADNLFLTNLLSVASDNTVGYRTTLYAGINLYVRAPTLSIQKTADQTIVDADDTIGFDITIKNNGGAIAYDVVVTDTPQTGLGNCSAYSSNVAGSTNGDGNYVIASLAAGAEAVVSISCDALADVESGSILINQSSVSWTSTPNGTEFPPKTDTVSVNVHKPTPTKAIISTSEAHTDDALADLRPVTIGEIVRYQLKVALPEGHLTNLRITDALPDGLIFENDGTAKVAFVSSAGAITTDIGALSGCGTINQVGNESSVDSITPSCPITPTGGTFVSGTNPIFALSTSSGHVANTDSDADKEYVVIAFNARVLDIPSNSNTSAKINAISVQTQTLNIASNNRTIKLVEPLLQVAKLADKGSVDAGDTITYTVNISHISAGTVAQQSTANAYDVKITDIMQSGLSYNAGTLLGTCTGGLNPVTSDSDPSGAGFTLTLPSLPLGQTCALTFKATALLALMSSDQITNKADLNWSSLPLNGTTPNPTGTTPQVGNERSGAKFSTAIVQINDPIPAKSIVSTSLVHTSEAGVGTVADPRLVSIGETIRYRLVTKIAEGTATNIIIKDQIPAGLKFITGSAKLALVSNDASGGISTSLNCTGGSIAQSGNEVNLSTIIPNCGISAVAATFVSGTDVAFNLATLVNSDSDADKEYIVIEFEAEVLNETINQQEALLNNTFHVAINAVDFSTSSAAVAKVIEPQITPTATLNSTGVNSMHFTITLTNTGSTTAFQVAGDEGTQWYFDLPEGLRDISNITTSISGSVVESGTATVIQASDFIISGVKSTQFTLQKFMDITPNSSLVIEFDAEQIPFFIPSNSSTITVLEYSGQATGSTTVVRTGADLNTGSGNQPITSTAVKNDYRSELVMAMYQISGTVFEDIDVDGVKDAGERGLGEVTIVLDDGTSCKSVKTNADGEYGFFPLLAGNYTVYEAVHEYTPTPSNCPPTPQDPASYYSVTTNFPAVVITNGDRANINFADIQRPIFNPDHSGEVLPGNVIFYAHVFTAKTDGTVSFSTANTGTASAGWNSTLYHDSNCNGNLESNEVVISTTTINKNVEDTVCIINKVFASSAASNGESYINSINANFRYGNGVLIANSTLKITDLSKVASGGSNAGTSRLELIKTVENITQGGAETETQNEAKGGDVLRYRIYYSNTGTGVITDLKVNDVVPEFTALLTQPSCETPLPASLTSCVATMTGSDIEWVFGINDVLKGGASGMVSYEVEIE